MKLFIGQLFIAFALLFTFSSNADAQMEKEFLRFETPKVELGKVKKGEKRTMYFEYTNVSKEDVQIDLVSACSCTTSDYSTKVLKPGAKDTLKLTFDSGQKDESGTILIDIFLTNEDAETGIPGMASVEYSYELVK